jgi:hypothetical protein
MQTAIPVMTSPVRGALRVVPDAQLEASLQAQARKKVELERQAAAQQQAMETELAGFVRSQYEHFSNHRNSQSGWSERLLTAMRVFNGQYDSAKLAAIRQFGGSEVYARIVAMKCRGATSLLRDVYLSATDRPWGLAPPADPDIPEDLLNKIKQIVLMEAATLYKAGMPVDPMAVRDRFQALQEEARMAAKKNAKKRVKLAEDRVEEILVEGGFYKAFADMLVDVPLFPFAAMRGPTVRIMPKISYSQGVAVSRHVPKMCWYRVSPFDLYWTPGASSIDTADVIERGRITRGELNDLLDLPGYNHAAVRAVLDEYGAGGLVDNWDSTDSERALYENRENPQFNRSGLINYLEYTGNVQGRLLIDFGMGEEQGVTDPIRDYHVQVWVIGRHVIKTQMTPSPRKRHDYYITSFEKVPGTPVGNALPDILADIEDVCNATLRALVNNLSISSGPQVGVNDDRLAPGETGENMHPWKRWHFVSDPSSNNSQPPIIFFQPESHAQELIAVYEKFNAIADEISAIPKYLSGQGVGSGAGRTASGLAMLMGNASKILQTVAANIDRDIMDPLLSHLYDMLMMTDAGEGLLQGDEQIQVKGVNVAIQRETERSRQLEFLQVTANPLDQQIMGPNGRATVLRSVASTIGLDGENIVPSEEQIKQMLMAAAQAAPPPGAADPAAEAQGNQPSGGVNGDMGPRTNIAGATG